MRSNIMKNPITTLTVILIATAIALPAGAATFLYSSSKRQVNAGVLVGRNWRCASPYVFLVMDQRADVKPRGWEFVNPLANCTGAADVCKGLRSYWEVDISNTIIDNLMKFDILYLSVNNNISLSADEREKLRSYVESGGMLWIDESDIPGDYVGKLFIRGFDFKTGASPGSEIMIVSRHHPLLTSPYWLTPWEISQLGYNKMSTTSYLKIGDPDPKSAHYDPTLLLPVVKNPNITDTDKNLAYVAGALYGSGYVVATAGNIGKQLCGIIPRNTEPSINLRDPVTMGHFAYVPANAVKFGYNIANWSASWTAFRKNARRTAGSMEDIGGSLIHSWTLPNKPSTIIENSAVLYKNVFFYTDASGTLYALDAVPQQDLDGDGNPDDGLWDDGAKYDIIWKDEVPGGANCSAPTFAELRLKGQPVDVVLVQGADGFVHAWWAFPHDLNTGQLSGEPVPAFSLSPFPTNWPSGAMEYKPHPPIFHDGWIYHAGRDGYLRAYGPPYDLSEGNSWIYPASVGIPGLPGDMPGSPVIGSVKNESNGAILDTVYYAVKGGMSPGPGASGNQNDRIIAAPVSVRNERLTRNSKNPLDGSYSTSIGSRKIADTPSPEIWVRDEHGNPASTAGITVVSNSMDGTAGGAPGFFHISGNDKLPNWSVFANYRVDYAQLGIVMIDQYSLMPDLNSRPGDPGPLGVAGAMALGRNGFVYLSGVRGSGFGEVQCVQSGFHTQNWQMKWRYLLHGGWYGPVQFPGVVMDATQNPAGEPVQRLQPSPSPAIAGDKLFVTASTVNYDPAVDPPGRAGSALLCFNADPDFIIRIHEPLIDPTNNRRRQIKLWQPDPLLNSPDFSPVSEAADVPSQMIDYTRGTVTINDFTSLMLKTGPGYALPGSQITPALPVLVFVDGVELASNQVDLGQWNNLQWYMVPYHDSPDAPCTGKLSSPVVMGDHVYFTCEHGYIFSCSTETGVTGGKQVLSVQPAYSTEDPVSWKKRNPHVKWMEKFGSAGAVNSSIAGANGLLAAIWSDGIYGFDNPLTIVADNRRLVELDGSGNITWTCEAVDNWVENPSSTSGSPSYSIERQTLNRPAAVKIANPGDNLVVDTGNNQVLRVARTGEVTWSLRSFKDPEGLLRPGDPLQLSGPTDAYAWAETIVRGGVTSTVIHHLIADGGNFRILDIVDEYRQDGTVDRQRLNWVSNTLDQGRQYQFRNVQLWAPNPSSPTEQFVLAGITNFSANPETIMEHSGGSVVLLEYRTYSSWGSQPTYRTGNIWPNDGYSHILVGDERLPLAGLRHVSRSYDGAGWSDLICMSSGIYKVNSSGNNKALLTSTQYSQTLRQIEGGEFAINAPLVATSAKWVGPNRLLVTNGYSGLTGRTGALLEGKFSGEVFEFDTADGKITWYSPRIIMDKNPGGGLSTFKQHTENGANLEQPSSADRVR